MLSTLTSPPAVFLQRIAPEMFDVVGFIDMYPLLEREREKKKSLNVCVDGWGRCGCGSLCPHYVKTRKRSEQKGKWCECLCWWGLREGRERERGSIATGGARY